MTEAKVYENDYMYLYPDDDQFDIKIVGGKVSKANSYPFAALLTPPKYKKYNAQGHFCG